MEGPRLAGISGLSSHIAKRAPVRRGLCTRTRKDLRPTGVCLFLWRIVDLREGERAAAQEKGDATTPPARREDARREGGVIVRS